MNPLGARHVAVVSQLHDLFHRLLGETAIVSMHTRSSSTNTASRSPTSHFFDRAAIAMRQRYRAQRMSCFWLKLLRPRVSTAPRANHERAGGPASPRSGWWSSTANGSVIGFEVFADRARSAYRRSRICERGDELAPEFFPRCQLRVTDILA